MEDDSAKSMSKEKEPEEDKAMFGRVEVHESSAKNLLY